MDRYDLFPISQGLDLDLDFVSEGFGDTGDAHSAFSDPSAWVGPSDMRRGGFTHHSNYAGDLIFGARTHQPSGPSRMDYGPGFGFGLGLGGCSSVEASSSYVVEDPSQTLSSASPSDMGSTSVTSPALALQDSFPGLALDELVGIPSSDPADEALGQDAVDVTPDTSHHDTPPATPAHGYRMSARASTGTSAHHRSISVPPSEHRAFMPPRTGQSQAVSPRAKQKYLMATPTRAAFGALPLPPTSVPLPPDTPALSASPWPYAALADYSTYQVPYLDLQYYHTNDAQMLPNMASTNDSLPLRAQALDLAQTLARTMTPQATNSAKPFCIPPSLMQLVSDSASSVGNAHSRMPSSNHHRGQSVASVSPQDLELRKGNDNKRKRASWDGGPR
ncbi:hypothetical protein BC629DRAFT_1600061 [Irpex lacteus]|nr:hypothetical protein BC629DRAFT_1600061 [Irpex lacteus]